MEVVGRSYRVSFMNRGNPVVCLVHTNTRGYIIDACPFLRRFIGGLMDNLEQWLEKTFDDVEIEIL